MTEELSASFFLGLLFRRGLGGSFLLLGRRFFPRCLWRRRYRRRLLDDRRRALGRCRRLFLGALALQAAGEFRLSHGAQLVEPRRWVLAHSNLLTTGPPAIL